MFGLVSRWAVAASRMHAPVGNQCFKVCPWPETDPWLIPRWVITLRLAGCLGWALGWLLPSAPLLHLRFPDIPWTSAWVHPHCGTSVAPKTRSFRHDHVYPPLQLWEEGEERGSHSCADPRGHHVCFWPLAQLSNVTTWLWAILRTLWVSATSLSRATMGGVSGVVWPWASLYGGPCTQLKVLPQGVGIEWREEGKWTVGKNAWGVITPVPEPSSEILLGLLCKHRHK